MAGLLPSTPDIDPNEEPRVVGLDSEDADELIDALSSDTTRSVLATLHEDPAPASALAERVDTSLQNVQYHLRKLEDAGLVEVGDTVYSEKGREMNVYVPSDRALVVVAGREEETTGLKAALSRLLGGVGILGLASVLVDRLARRGFLVGPGSSGDDAADGGAAPAADSDAATTSPTAAADGDGGGGGFDVAEATTTTTGPTEATVVDTTASTATAAPDATATAGPDAAAATPTPFATPNPTAPPTAVPTEETATAVDLTAEAVGTTAATQPGSLAGLLSSPGALFFLGGSAVLVGGFVRWWLGRSRAAREG